MNFPHLFSPFAIGSMQLKNRIVMAPMETHLGNADGSVSPQMIAYYRERALGGVGLVIVEYTCVDGSDGFSSWSPQLLLDNPRFRSGHAKLVRAIQLAGAKTCVELSHAGRQTRQDIIGAQPVAPSAVTLVARQFTTHPRALGEDDIERLIARFAQSASYAVDAGYDAVMLHGAHGYLLHQFLSARVNHRDDAWGGSFERRLQFPLAVVRAVKRAIGDRPLLFRLSVIDRVENGLTLEDAERIAPALRDAGVDAIDISRGSIEATDLIVEPMDIGEGSRLGNARRVRAVAGIPVLCAGVMRWPDKAEAAVAEGDTDLVSLGRALLADPFWPAKASRGEIKDIRPCTSCNWCVKEALSQRAIGCAENPRCGRESDAAIGEFGRGKRAVVVGAGPGGIAASLMLDQAGFEVDLFERRATLGGNLLASAAPPGKEKLYWYRDFLLRRLGLSKVRVHLGCTADAQIVLGCDPEAVILATGAELAPIALDRNGSLTLEAAYRVLLGDIELRQGTYDVPVVIYGGGETGAEVAEYLALRDHDVMLVTRSSAGQIARNADRSYRQHLLARLRGNARIRIIEHTQVVSCGEGDVTLAHGGNCTAQPASALLLAHGVSPDRGLVDALHRAIGDCHRGSTLPVICIGDGRAVARIGEAVRDAYDAVNNLRRKLAGEEMLHC